MASNSSNETAPATKLCENCKKDVLSANYDMHSVHCLRFMRFCDYCDQLFSKEKWDDHIDFLHGEICCKDCGKLVAKRFMQDHLKKDCNFRLQACKYCDLALPYMKAADHEDFCGSRTDLCKTCNRYVTFKELETHRCDGQAPPAAAAKAKTAFGYPGAVDFVGDGLGVDDFLHGIPFSLERFSRLCRFCHKSEHILGVSLEEHKEVCPDQPVSCKYCPEKVPMAFLESHEAMCPGMMIVCPECGENVRMEEVARHSEVCGGPEARDFFDYGENHRSPDGKVKLPCEFCHELFSTDMLIQHESGCAAANRYDSSDERARD